jgi:hypothetical protein
MTDEMMREWVRAIEAGRSDADELSPVEHFARAIRAAALEEAAKVAERTYEGSCGSRDGDSGFDFNGENSAAAIRALMGAQ